MRVVGTEVVGQKVIFILHLHDHDDSTPFRPSSPHFGRFFLAPNSSRTWNSASRPPWDQTNMFPLTNVNESRDLSFGFFSDDVLFLHIFISKSPTCSCTSPTVAPFWSLSLATIPLLPSALPQSDHRGILPQQLLT